MGIVAYSVSAAGVRFTVHDDVEPLVEECDEATDQRGVVPRLLVCPGDVGDDAVAGRGRPVGRLSLVGAVGAGAAGGELGANVAGRQVVAGGQHGLEQQRGPGRLGQHVAVQFHPDLARAGKDVDAVERVTGMGHVELVLLIPGLERREVQDDVPGQVGVGGIEPRSGPVLPASAQVDRAPLGGVHGERNRGVKHGAAVQLWHAGAKGARMPELYRIRHDQLRGNVAVRDRVRRHDPARFPDQQGPGGVHDCAAAQDRADALAGRFVPQLAETAG